MINLLLQRNLSSYNFKKNTNLPDSFSNNYAQNSRDWLIVLDDKAEIARFRCQSVANYCFGEMATADSVPYGDTIAPGPFKIRLFAEPRNFHGEIHEIIEATDLDGQRINTRAMQTTEEGFQNGRWLIHDKFSKKYGTDTNYAWSAGCIILSSGDLQALNLIFHACKLSPGAIISGKIVEV